LIPELNTSVDLLLVEATESKYYDPKNIDPEKMAEIIKDLTAKKELFE
jgi:hypothetical protein